MKKILLVCAAGMSTSMLVKRMIDHANAISLEVNISALAIAEAKGKIKNNEVDVVLLIKSGCYFYNCQIRILPIVIRHLKSATRLNKSNQTQLRS
ncbi:PTS sugar transporter subunit IIB [Escherichia sp. R-CC3]